MTRLGTVIWIGFSLWIPVSMFLVGLLNQGLVVWLLVLALSFILAAYLLYRLEGAREAITFVIWVIGSVIAVLLANIVSSSRKFSKD